MKRQSREPINPELLFPPFNKSSHPLTVEEVAAVIRQHPRTIRRLARMGTIPGAFQAAGKGGGWRFKRKEFELWWKAQGSQQ
jgi:excisionase family DNA binding protein